MNALKKGLAVFSAITALLSITACGKVDEVSFSGISHKNESDLIQNEENASKQATHITSITKSKETVTANVEQNSIETENDTSIVIADEKVSAESVNDNVTSEEDIEGLQPTTEHSSSDKQNHTRSETTFIFPNDAMVDTDNAPVTPKTETPVVQGDGDILVVSDLMQQVGTNPLRLSKEESALVKELMTGIDMQPCGEIDIMKIPYGGALIVEIEGGTKYYFLGADYIRIDDTYYYDSTGTASEVSGSVANIMHNYYGAP